MIFPLKIQRILLFIPRINCLLFLVMYYNMFHVEKLTLKKVLGAMGIVVIVWAIGILSLNLVKEITVLTHGILYACELLTGFICYRVQKKCGVR